MTSDAGQNGQRCPAVRKDGQPCGATPTGSGWCFAHDPAGRQWRAKGGASTSRANRATRLMPARLQPLVRALEQVFYEVRSGARSEKSGVALARIATAIRDLIMAGEVEERTRQLEQLAREWRHGQERQGSVASWWGGDAS